MKLLTPVSGIVSVVFFVEDISWLLTTGIFSSGQISCISGITSGIPLSLGLYAFHLRDRVQELEKRMQELP